MGIGEPRKAKDNMPKISIGANLGSMFGSGLGQGIAQGAQQRQDFNELLRRAQQLGNLPEGPQRDIALGLAGVGQKGLDPISQILSVFLGQQLGISPQATQPYSQPTQGQNLNGVGQVVVNDPANPANTTNVGNIPAGATSFQDPQTGKIFYDYNGALYDEQGFAVDDDGNRI